MDEFQQLQERLAMLEQLEDQRKQQAQLDGFMGQFGSKFGNNKDIGAALLDEMNARGMATDTSNGVVAEALEGALEQILGELNEEVTGMMGQLQSLAQTLAQAKTTVDMASPAISEDATMDGIGAEAEAPPGSEPPVEDASMDGIGAEEEGDPAMDGIGAEEDASMDGMPPEGEVSDQRAKDELKAVQQGPDPEGVEGSASRKKIAIDKAARTGETPQQAMEGLADIEASLEDEAEASAEAIESGQGTLADAFGDAPSTEVAPEGSTEEYRAVLGEIIAQLAQAGYSQEEIKSQLPLALESLEQEKSGEVSDEKLKGAPKQSKTNDNPFNGTINFNDIPQGVA